MRFRRLMANAWDRDQLNVPMDWGVFAFAAAVTLLTGVVFGLAPAWLAARSEVSSSLKESAQTTTRRRKGLGGKAIVAFQIALSTLLVVGAGLFLRTLLALNSVDVGFRTDHLVLFEIAPPAQAVWAGQGRATAPAAGAGVCGIAGGGGRVTGSDGLYRGQHEQLRFHSGGRDGRRTTTAAPKT